MRSGEGGGDQQHTFVFITLFIITIWLASGLIIHN